MSCVCASIEHLLTRNDSVDKHSDSFLLLYAWVQVYLPTVQALLPLWLQRMGQGHILGAGCQLA